MSPRREKPAGYSLRERFFAPAAGKKDSKAQQSWPGGVPRDWQRSQGFFPLCQHPLRGACWRLLLLGGGKQPRIIPAPFKPPRQPYQFLLVRRWVAGVAVGVEQELGVAVDGDESLDVPVVLHKVHDGLHLGL